MVDERSWGTMVAWLLAGALVVFAGWKLLGPSRSGAAGKPVSVTRPGVAGSQGRRGGVGVYVHVAGAVRRPGLYRLPAGARIAAAIERAGGPAHHGDLSGVNLAARVEDGQQVVVPRAGAGATPAGAAPAGAAGPGAKVSLGSATVEQLDGLDGIGPTLAKRIVEYRQAHGGFRSLEELKQVEGIGDKRFEALQDALQP